MDHGTEGTDEARQTRIVPVEFSIKGDWLVWTWLEHPVPLAGHGTGRAKKRLDSVSALSEFVRVFEKEGNILEFARAFGPLGLCEHGLPLYHGGLPKSGSMGDSSGFRRAPRINEFARIHFTSIPVLNRYYCPPHKFEGFEKEFFSLSKDKHYFAESLSLWHFYADQAGAVLRIVNQLKSDRRPFTADVLSLRALLNDQPYQVTANYKGVANFFTSRPNDENRGHKALMTLSQSRGEIWNLVASVLNEWLVHARVRFYCDGVTAGQKFKIRPYVGDERGIFPELALQLTTAVTGLQSPLICSGCGFPFMPVRERTTGERTYCQVCRDNRVPQRDAERAYRQKNPRKAKARGKN
jgi:hypothetical protein